MKAGRSRAAGWPVPDSSADLPAGLRAACWRKGRAACGGRTAERTRPAADAGQSHPPGRPPRPPARRGDEARADDQSRQRRLPPARAWRHPRPAAQQRLPHAAAAAFARCWRPSGARIGAAASSASRPIPSQPHPSARFTGPRPTMAACWRSRCNIRVSPRASTPTSTMSPRCCAVWPASGRARHRAPSRRGQGAAGA
jgi:hypothetical protein